MPNHRRSARRPADPEVAWVLDRIIWVLAGCNALVGVALIVGTPGPSPALLFLRMWGIPLVIWGGAYLTVTVLILLDQRVAAHAVAVSLWLIFGAGALYGLLTGATSSPTASMILTVTVLSIGAVHVVGFLFRRKITRRP